MVTENHKEPSFPVKNRKVESAEVPVSVTPADKSQFRLKKSRYFGVLLYRNLTEKLTDQQKGFIAYYQGKLQLEELLSAWKFTRILLSDPRARSRVRIHEIRVPALYERAPAREKRRIGVGYRDKGTLRPLHKPGPIGERWWSEWMLNELSIFDYQPGLGSEILTTDTVMSRWSGRKRSQDPKQSKPWPVSIEVDGISIPIVPVPNGIEC